MFWRLDKLPFTRQRRPKLCADSQIRPDRLPFPDADARLPQPTIGSKNVMTEIIFSVDYELYGNGDGTLRDLVLEPAAALAEVFDRNDAKFVVFVEALELARIKRADADPDIGPVCDQIRRLHRDGHEIALHIHPQWANARHRNGAWELDYSEYTLGALSRERIESIVDESLDFLRGEIQDSSFRPIAFRAGNWLIQPSERVADVLADRGIKIDSSLFKGGFHRKPSIDYRAAARNPGYYWRFRSDVNRHDPNGVLLEVPIYTALVPMWHMITRKRLTLQRRSISRRKAIDADLAKWRDYARPSYPLKFDFCRMSFPEMTSMVEREASRGGDAQGARPMVAIGHTKDLEDAAPVHEFLRWLRSNGIRVTTFRSAYARYLGGACVQSTSPKTEPACQPA